VGFATPYQIAAVDYAGFGWSPIPLPTKKKSPPPDGYTGAKGAWVKLAKAQSWAKPRARFEAGGDSTECGNIALRLPANVIGIDVDAYDGRSGADTLAKAEEAWGELPATWLSSSRDDGASGIRLFVVPEGLSWPESLRGFHGGGVDIIRWDHRYAIVFPSVHDKTGAVYRWTRPDGQVTTDEVPGVEELATLPPSWVEGLTSGAIWEGRAEKELTSTEVKVWVSGCNGSEDDPCEVMAKTLAKWTRAIGQAGEDGGAHDVARDGAWAVLGDAAAGHTGVSGSLGTLRQSFLDAVAGRTGVGRRGARKAGGEWSRAVELGVRKVAAEGPVEDSDLCAEGPEQWTPEKIGRERSRRSLGSAAFDYARTDIGNGRRLVHLVRGDILSVDKDWYVWDGHRWQRNEHAARRYAIEMVDDMEKEAEFIENEKQKMAFTAFIKSSGMAGKIRAMMEVAASLPGMSARLDEFDADPSLLLCPNGVLELRDEGLGFRPVSRDDRMTHITRAPYVEGAHSAVWEKFLERSVPDGDVRHWLQKAFGYSLYGGNPRRLLFFIEGKTSSGKTTLMEAVRHVLGDYAGPFDLSLFRSIREQGANVALVRAMSKRIVSASEASSDWHLHADQIKRLTGGDALSARLNFSNDLVEAVPAFTPWIVMNPDSLTINGADLALYRRMRTIPLNETITEDEEDEDLIRKLREPEALSAILTWLALGWAAFAEEGLQNPPTAVLEATMATQEQLSEFDDFLKTCCVREAEARETSRNLYAAYKHWCEENGSKPETSAMFGRNLGKRGLQRLEPFKSNGVTVRGWGGIRVSKGYAKIVKGSGTWDTTEEA
jgi:P4 family phage/plasmid primase-like protien